MRKLILVPLALALALAATAVAATPTKTVTVGDDYFVKNNGKTNTVTVKKDTLVKWKWVGTGDHNVVGEKGPKKFESKYFSKKGINYKRKFGKPGTYTIICELHGGTMIMKLKVKSR